MAGKDEEGRARADAGIEIVDVGRARFGKCDPLRRKARLFQRGLEDAERAAVLRRHRGASDERAAKVEGGRCMAFGIIPMCRRRLFIAWAGCGANLPRERPCIRSTRKSCRQICFKGR